MRSPARILAVGMLIVSLVVAALSWGLTRVYEGELCRDHLLDGCQR